MPQTSLASLLSERQSPALERYTVSTLLGEGGMGRVYLGEDTKLSRPVAIKILGGVNVGGDNVGGDNLGGDKSGFAADGEEASEARRRFYREAKVLAALKHPHIIQIYDYSGPRRPHLF